MGLWLCGRPPSLGSTIVAAGKVILIIMAARARVIGDFDGLIPGQFGHQRLFGSSDGAEDQQHGCWGQDCGAVDQGQKYIAGFETLGPPIPCICHAGRLRQDARRGGCQYVYPLCLFLILVTCSLVVARPLSSPPYVSCLCAEERVGG